LDLAGTPAGFSRAVEQAGVYVLGAWFDDSELPGLLADTPQLARRWAVAACI
jgi:hypothetical protein